MPGSSGSEHAEAAAPHGGVCPELAPSRHSRAGDAARRGSVTRRRQAPWGKGQALLGSSAGAAQQQTNPPGSRGAAAGAGVPPRTYLGQPTALA